MYKERAEAALGFISQAPHPIHGLGTTEVDLDQAVR